MKGFIMVILVMLWSGFIGGIYWLLQSLPQWLTRIQESPNIAALTSLNMGKEWLLPEAWSPMLTRWAAGMHEFYPLLMSQAHILLWGIWGLGILLLCGGWFGVFGRRTTS